MKHFLILFFVRIAASICQATWNITFSGGGYDISVYPNTELIVASAINSPRLFRTRCGPISPIRHSPGEIDSSACNVCDLGNPISTKARQ
jgi:hypothetical protein